MAHLEVVSSSVEAFSGYRIYPVPQAAVDEQGSTAGVGELFVQDESAYSTDGLYPDSIAALGKSYVLRDQVKQQVIFYPISFNPVSGQLNLYRRIELRIDFVEATYAKVDTAGHMPWQPPESAAAVVLSPLAIGFAAAPLMVNPISPILSSLGAAAAALWSPPDSAQGPVYKITTGAEGIYRLTKDYLNTNGVDTAAINLSQVRIYHLGQEMAIDVFDQNSDDQMDAADTISFYAAPLDERYVKYSDQNVYWLTFSGGSGAPLRMAGIEAAPAGGSVAEDFMDTVSCEQDSIYWLKVPGAESIERWFFDIFVFGDQHAGGGLPVPFTVTVPNPSSSGSLSLSMVGQTDAHHQVKVAINGEQQVFSWSGMGLFEASLDNIPLVDGDNTVSLQCLSADGNDAILVDWFKITYRRDYVAADNTLKFAPDSDSRYQIGGFSDNSLLAYDISNPAEVAKIKNAIIAGADPYQIEFEPSVYGNTYLVVASDAIHTPEGIVAERTSRLFDTANGADYILITHRDIGWDGSGDQLSWLTDLVAHRQASGLRVFVADIQDIYDEFSYGIKGPAALKDFLAYAYSNWQAPAPGYVLLVGDSSFDPKDNFNEADTTAYLPTYLIYTDYKGETVTDQWFVTISGDDAVADMHIGRLPAADAAQAAVMVAKIIAYETAPNAQTWSSDVLLVADNQRGGQEYAYEAVFETINDAVADLLPFSMADPFKGYLNDYSATVFLTEDIIDSLNDGVLMVNFSGHGATGIWADEHIFDAADVAALTNTDRLAFFVSMSCETGFFAYPEAAVWSPHSLAEVLLRSDAGAVAALMPTGMTTTDGQQVLDTALFEAIFAKDIRRLGPAIADAKQTLLANGDAYFEQIADTFLLFGDPATELKVPLPHIPTGLGAVRKDGRAKLLWDATLDCNGNPVAGYNLYRAETAAGPFSKINTAPISDTAYVDTGSGYYVVSAVDSGGVESAKSLAVKPAAGGSSSGSGGGAGCFISTTTGTLLINGWGLIIILTVLLTIVIGVRFRVSGNIIRCQVSGVRKKMD